MIKVIPDGLKDRPDKVQDILLEIAIQATLADIMHSHQNILKYNIQNKQGENVAEKILEHIEQTTTEALIEIAATETGADIEDVRNPESRTPEQQAIMTELLEKHNILQQRRFEASQYFQAIQLLMPLEQKFPDSSNPNDISIKEQAALYFFAINDEFEMKNPKPLTKKQIKGITDIFYRLDKFYVEHFNEKENNSTEPLTLYDFVEAENPIEAPAITEYLETMITAPDKYIVPNDKIANILNAVDINGKTYSISEEKRGAKAEKTSYITLNFDELENEICLNDFNTRLTRTEDIPIYEAVVSLMQAGNSVITPHSIYKTLTGNASNQISEKWIDTIEKSMKKLNSIVMKFDLTEALDYYPELKAVIKEIGGETRLLQFKTIWVTTKNGSRTKAYSMLDKPILFAIANAKSQVASFDIKLLENSKTKNTVDNTALKIFLLKKINAMTHSQNVKPVILFETLYSELNRNTDREKRTTKENAEQILMQFKADKIIKDFSFEKKGRRLQKINITLHPNSPLKKNTD